MQIFVARHGEAGNNVPTPINDEQFAKGDPKLTLRGRAIARNLARMLCEFVPEEPLLIVSSPYYRAAETAQLICEELDTKFHVEPDLGECRHVRYGIPAHFQGLNAVEAIMAFDRLAEAESLYGDWWPTDNEALYTCSRRIERLLKRSLYFLQAKGYGSVLFVTHCIAGKNLIQLLDNAYKAKDDIELGSLSLLNWDIQQGLTKVEFYNKKPAESRRIKPIN